MDLVFVIDEISTLTPAHDSSVALMEAAQARGHRVLVTTASRLEFANGQTMAFVRPVRLQPATLRDGRWQVSPRWFSLEPTEYYRLNDASALFLRTDPPVNAQYLRATHLLDLVDASQTLMINSPTGVRTANEKLFALRLPSLGPATLVSADRHQIRETVAEWGKAVLKPTDAMAGRGILILDPADPNMESILDSATERGHCQVIVQRWLSACSEGDRRIIVLDGEPAGAVRRIARSGEFRCNMAAGATVAADSVTEADRVLCAALAPLLREHGLPFAGIDVIGGKLTEVNVTSPTGLREIDALSGTRLASDILIWAERHSPAPEKAA